MRLREMSFVSSKQMVEFVNYRELEPQHVQTILSRAHPNEKLPVTLVFWDDGKYIPPLKETEPAHEEEKNLKSAYQPGEVPMPVTSREIAAVNTIYEKAKIVAEDAEMMPEKVSDFLERKDKERQRLGQIKQAAGELRQLPGESEEIGEQEDFQTDQEEKEKWLQVQDQWRERYPDSPLDILFDELTVKDKLIYVPMHFFGDDPKGSTFYKLSLLIEEIFGDAYTLDYL